jgi:hypothetical protein
MPHPAHVGLEQLLQVTLRHIGRSVLGQQQSWWCCGMKQELLLGKTLASGLHLGAAAAIGQGQDLACRDAQLGVSSNNKTTPPAPPLSPARPNPCAMNSI